MNFILRLLGLCRTSNVVEAVIYLRDVERAVGSGFQMGDRHATSAMRIAHGIPPIPHKGEELLLTAQRRAGRL